MNSNELVKAMCLMEGKELLTTLLCGFCAAMAMICVQYLTGLL